MKVIPCCFCVQLSSLTDMFEPPIGIGLHYDKQKVKLRICTSEDPAVMRVALKCDTVASFNITLEAFNWCLCINQ